MQSTILGALAVLLELCLCVNADALPTISHAVVHKDKLVITGNGLLNLDRTVTFDGQGTTPSAGGNTAKQIVVTLKPIPTPGTYRFTVAGTSGFVSVGLVSDEVGNIQVTCGNDGVCNVNPAVFLDKNLSMVILLPDNNSENRSRYSSYRFEDPAGHFLSRN